jgi:hypothetical protein
MHGRLPAYPATLVMARPSAVSSVSSAVSISLQQQQQQQHNRHHQLWGSSTGTSNVIHTPKSAMASGSSATLPQHAVTLAVQLREASCSVMLHAPTRQLLGVSMM